MNSKADWIVGRVHRYYCQILFGCFYCVFAEWKSGDCSNYLENNSPEVQSVWEYLKSILLNVNTNVDTSHYSPEDRLNCFIWLLLLDTV